MENIVVIGGGLMGCAAAWQLSQYGKKVLLIEQQGKQQKESSSYGASRITRSLGVKNDLFSYVQRKTIEESKILLRFLNGIGAKKHQMKDIYSTSPVTYIYHQNQLQEIQQLKYKKQKDNFKKGTGDNAFRKFGMTIPEDYIVVREYKKYSGVMNPKVMISKLRQGIKKHGNKIHYHLKATNITRKGDHYEIKIRNTKTGKKKVLQTQRVIVATGPYTVPLLRYIAPYFKRLIIPKKLVLSFFKINKKVYTKLSKEQKKTLKKAHPVFDQNDEMFFSMIDKIGKDGIPIFKVGGHQIRRNIPNLNRVWQQVPLKKEIKWARKSFKKYLEMLEIFVTKKDIEYVEGYNCVYAVSPTKIPYVTHLLTKEDIIDKGIVVIGGMSGTGAKGCLAYGQLAADLLLQRADSNKKYQQIKRKLSGPISCKKKYLKSRYS